VLRHPGETFLGCDVGGAASRINRLRKLADVAVLDLGTVSLGIR
jgi:hypothetical protein